MKKVIYIEGPPTDEQVDELLDALLGPAPDEEDEAAGEPEEPAEEEEE